jgi:hypothetical protein
LTGRIDTPQIDCFLLHTTDRVHALVRCSLEQSPLFNGRFAVSVPLLPVARRQSRALSDRSVTRSSSSRKVSMLARSTSTACR